MEAKIMIKELFLVPLVVAVCTLACQTSTDLSMECLPIHCMQGRKLKGLVTESGFSLQDRQEVVYRGSFGIFIVTALASSEASMFITMQWL